MVDKEQPVAPTDATDTKSDETNKDGSGDQQAQPKEEEITLKKSEHDQLTAKAERAERAEALQAQADKRAQRTRSDLRKARAKLRVAGPKSSDTDAGDSTDLADVEQAQMETDATKGIMQLGFDPKYQTLMQKDATLREILSDNPLALVKGEVMDAEEAIDQVRDNLDERVEKLQADKVKSGDEETPNVSPTAKPVKTAPDDPKTMSTEQLREWIAEDPNRWSKLDDAQRTALKGATITTKR